MFDGFEHFALRAFEPGFSVGDRLPNSKRWIDGECLEDEELNGASGIKVTSAADIAEKIGDFREKYAFGNRIVYIIGGNFGEWGEDDGEFIIRKAVVVSVIGE